MSGAMIEPNFDTCHLSRPAPGLVDQLVVKGLAPEGEHEVFRVPLQKL